MIFYVSKVLSSIALNVASMSVFRFYISYKFYISELNRRPPPPIAEGKWKKKSREWNAIYRKKVGKICL